MSFEVGRQTLLTAFLTWVISEPLINEELQSVRSEELINASDLHGNPLLPLALDQAEC